MEILRCNYALLHRIIELPERFIALLEPKMEIPGRFIAIPGCFIAIPARFSALPERTCTYTEVTHGGYFRSIPICPGGQSFWF